MKWLYILMFLVYPLITKGQEIINFNDTVSFQIIEIEDTIDIDYNHVTPYPNSLELDLDCDGEKDIKFYGYPTPIMNFPPAHNIEIQNLIGSDLEFLNTSWLIKAYRNDDEINIGSISGWQSKNTYNLLYFHVVGGASWAGESANDSSMINNMYLVFRKKENNEYKYGWIKYSGKVWPTILSVNKIAVSKIFCLQTSDISEMVQEPKITIFPNPFEGIVKINIPNPKSQNIKWRITSIDNVMELEGKITDINTEIVLDQLSGSFGIYLLQIIIDGRITKSQILLKKV